MMLQTLGWSDFFQTHYDGMSHDPGIPARIIGVGKSIFLISDGVNDFTATLPGTFSHKGHPYPITGDWVTVKKGEQDSSGRIISVIPRKNVLTRRAAGSAGKQIAAWDSSQEIAANIDIGCIVTGLDRDFNLRRIERFLTIIYNCGTSPMIILNKADVCPDPESCKAEVESIAYGVPVHVVSASANIGMAPIREAISPGVTAVMLGSSGAGKSTIVNSLYGSNVRKTKETADYSGKGVHTTTSRDLIRLPEGGMIIDNPGIREVGLWNEGDGLQATFSDIFDLAHGCRFADCTHSSEPGCRVKEAVENGTLDRDRYHAYHRLKRESDYLTDKTRLNASAIEKKRWKGISKYQKHIKKHRW